MAAKKTPEQIQEEKVITELLKLMHNMNNLIELSIEVLQVRIEEKE